MQQPPRSIAGQLSTDELSALEAGRGRNMTLDTSQEKLNPTEIENPNPPAPSKKSWIFRFRIIFKFCGGLRDSLSKRPTDSGSLQVDTSSTQETNGATQNPEYMEKIGLYPRGYPMLAAFMNLDPAFMTCRSFTHLHTRVLLYKQDELSELETELLRLDQEETEIRLSSRRRGDENNDRLELMRNISKKVEEYDKILQAQHFLSRLPLTNDRNYRSFSNWMNRITPLVDRETQFLQHREDLVTLTPKGDQGWLESVIEHCIGKMPKPIQEFFSPQNENLHTDDPTLHVFQRQRVASFVRHLNAVIAVVLLTPPVVILHQMETPAVRKYGLIVLVAFTLGFSISMSMFTRARKHEIFGATAAYVLPIFVHPSSLSPWKPTKIADLSISGIKDTVRFS